MFQKNKFSLGRKWLGISILLGAFFLVFQGYEWIQLLKFGFTLSSSVYGGLFYLLIGAHGFHVMGALGYSYLCMVPNEESSKSRKS